MHQSENEGAEESLQCEKLLCSLISSAFQGFWGSMFSLIRSFNPAILTSSYFLVEVPKEGRSSVVVT